MRRAPSRLLDSASLSPLERRVLDAGRESHIDFDVAAAAERLRRGIHSAGPAHAHGAVYPAAANSLKLACVLASVTGLGGIAYYGLSAGNAAPPAAESAVHAAPRASEAPAAGRASEVASAPPVRATASPQRSHGSSSARAPAAEGGSPTAARKRRASSRSSEAPQASRAIIEAQGPVESGPVPAPSSAPLAIGSARAIAPDANPPLVMAELRDVARARALLDREPAAALVVLQRLGVTQPRGFMLEERAALTVLALAATGQTGLAERHAAEFLRLNPESPFADRVRSAVKR